MLRVKYDKNLNIEGGLRLALSIFKEILGKNFELSRFDAAYINKNEKKITRLVDSGLKKYA